MDRPLTPAALRLLRLRRIAGIGLPIVGFTILLLLLPGWVRPTVRRASIRTATVTIGALDQVLTASGTVMPEIERVLPSPIDARLLSVLRRPGAALKAGDPIVALDTSESTLALRRLTTDVRISENQQAQAEIALDTALLTLEGRIEQKTLELRQAGEKEAAAARLFEQGLVAKQTLSDAQLAMARIRIELTQLEGERAAARRATALQVEGLSLQREALERTAAEAGRVLQLATMSADRDGVLTWVVTQEGMMIRRGDVVARLADLRSFRVDASLADVHRGQIRPGMAVAIPVSNETLSGRIAAVEPTVENGAVRFIVSLDDGADPALRPNLSVEVLVITDRVARALTIKQGPFADSTGASGPVFVVRGDRGVRTQVRFGRRGYEQIEVTGGLHEGDEVIISDMRDYLHLEEITIK